MMNNIPGPYAHLVTFDPTYLDLETVGQHDHVCDEEEHTITDEDILTAVSWAWSEDVCERLYATLNV